MLRADMVIERVGDASALSDAIARLTVRARMPGQSAETVENMDALPPFARWAIRRIVSDPAQWPVKRIVHEAGVDRRTLDRILVKTLSMTATQLRSRARRDLAERLRAEGRWTLKEIARKCGWADERGLRRARPMSDESGTLGARGEQRARRELTMVRSHE
jgi:AraC-like DNA-binding protein